MKAWILPRYVIRSALFAMMGAVVGLWLLQIIFAYLSELENLSETYTYFDALRFILYRSPYFLVQFIPTGALLGAVIGLGLLAGNSELVVMRAGGISVYRIIGYAMLPAFLFVMISLAVNQFVLPTTNDKASQIANHLPNKKLFTVNGYWRVNDTRARAGDCLYQLCRLGWQTGGNQTLLSGQRGESHGGDPCRQWRVP
ncbi:LptF/LptG family permease [Moraxella bovis]|nr:LptF/LptG family permease [Moraxella bovis]UZA40071.1 LptF/LptG family permease [Moraxella bovis]